MRLDPIAQNKDKVGKIGNSGELGTLAKKKRENVGILKKQGGGSTRIPHPFFTVFNMGDPPKKGPKMQNKP